MAVLRFILLVFLYLVEFVSTLTPRSKLDDWYDDIDEIVDRCRD